MAIYLITSGAFAPSRSPAAKSLLHAAQEAEFDQSIFRRYSMSYTDMDIEMKALSMLGSNVPDEDAVMLRTVCAAAAAELEGRLRRSASSDDMTELFTTAAGMLAISMYMELGAAHSGGVSGFTAGRLSVQLGGASAAALRKSAETLLGAYLDNGGFEFVGVQG